VEAIGCVLAGSFLAMGGFLAAGLGLTTGGSGGGRVPTLVVEMSKGSGTVVFGFWERVSGGMLLTSDYGKL
jgi:hypothetical protein